jgi:hypothetical protein
MGGSSRSIRQGLRNVTDTIYILRIYSSADKVIDNTLTVGARNIWDKKIDEMITRKNRKLMYMGDFIN